MIIFSISTYIKNMDDKDLYIKRIYYLYYKDRISFLMLKAFIQFLKEKGILEKFIEGVKNPKFETTNDIHNVIYKSPNSLLHGILVYKSPAFGYYIEQLINFAFYWAESEDGHAFWLNMNIEWKKYFNERFSNWKEKQRKKTK